MQPQIQLQKNKRQTPATAHTVFLKQCRPEDLKSEVEKSWLLQIQMCWQEPGQKSSWLREAVKNYLADFFR